MSERPTSVKAVEPSDLDPDERIPGGGDGAMSGNGRHHTEAHEATPRSAEEFYAKLTARPDVRAFLKRLADR